MNENNERYGALFSVRALQKFEMKYYFFKIVQRQSNRRTIHFHEKVRLCPLPLPSCLKYKPAFHVGKSKMGSRFPLVLNVGFQIFAAIS